MNILIQVPPVSTLLPEAQAQLSQQSLLVLQNCYEEAEEGPGALGARSPIPSTLQNPEDAPFVCKIYVHAHDTLGPAEYRSLFSPILEDLVWSARRSSLASTEASRGYQQWVQAAAQLCEVKTPDGKRPFAQLLTELVSPRIYCPLITCFGLVYVGLFYDQISNHLFT